GFARAIFLFRNCPSVIVGRAVAGLPILGTDPMAILGYFHGRPVVFRQSGNKASDDTGLSNIAGMPTDHNDSHYFLFAKRATTASCFKYSRTGRAGVPKNATPFPQNVLLGRTPLCPPSITPSSMRACSPTPT